jgi:hypothetical protein
MVVNEWHFLAFALSTNNTTGATWRVWRATLNTPVTEATVSVAVARSGNFTGSTAVYVGNKGTGTLAFQGACAGFGAVATSAAAGSRHPLQVSSYGSAWTQDQADQILRSVVIPAYEGNMSLIHQVCVNDDALGSTVFMHWRGDGPGEVFKYYRASTDFALTPTINGATVSQLALPRPVLADARKDSRVSLFADL